MHFIIHKKIIKWHWVNIICFLMIVILILSIIYFCKSRRFYELNYFGELNLKSSSSYDDIVSIYGEPNKIIVKDISTEYDTIYDITISYDDFDVLFINSEPEVKGSLRGKAYKVYSDKYKFGYKNVCVGTPKEDVKKAYEGCRKTIKVEADSDDKKDVYYDNHVHVTYIYDENDVVSSIEFFFYY